MATLDQAVEQMYAADMPRLPAGHPIPDGKFHRFGPRQKAWYVMREYLARNGRRYVAGSFGYWRGNESGAQKIRTDWSGIEPDELRRLQRSQAQLEAREQERRALRARHAANRAQQQWNAARAMLAPGERIPYLEKKGIALPKGLRFFADGTLLVPMVRYDVTDEQESDPGYTGARRLVGVQKIAPDGEKRFNKGMAKDGAACRLGKHPKDGQIILIGEGMATVASVVESLDGDCTAFVAFDAGNLLPVARIVRGLYPRSPILFLGDDDAYLEAQLNKRLRDEHGVTARYRVKDGEKTLPGKHGAVTVCADMQEDARHVQLLTGAIQTEGAAPRPFVMTNAGLTKAWAACSEIGNAWVVWPAFAARELSPDPEAPKATDFNDLHAAEGLDPVRAQVGEAIEAVRDAIELMQAVRDGVPAEDPEAAGARSGKARVNASSGSAGGSGGGGRDEPDWALHGSLLRRFTQIYPSDAAYDGHIGRIVRIAHMRLMFGGGPVNRWLASPRKRVIDPEQVVFDPTRSNDPETTVNLFRGLGIKPSREGSCELLLELLQYLCGEEKSDEAPATTWVLNWIAYMLQHVGAKMQTAVVMYGEEGTGKNMFWNSVRGIFGRHGALITQAELEDKFNTWQSAKLLVIANEVVTRAEMSHHVGRLKNMITEAEVYINPKMVDQRYERNHMNMVFLSNELQPLKIGPRDRRYMVIRTPNTRPEEFYKRVGAEIAAGGVAALYQRLLDLDVGEFNEHTKPIFTEAKRDLIEIGMAPSQLFWKDVKEGVLGLPYCPALVTDVYKAYTVWCARTGHKMPESLNRFAPNFMSLNGVRRMDKRVPDPDRRQEIALVGTPKEEEIRMRRVFVMGDAFSSEAAERQRIVEGVAKFRHALKLYLRDDIYAAEPGSGYGQEEAF